MACGTGKTFVGYEVAQGLKVKRVLVLVPSLLLVNQIIREYRAMGAKHILSVCSDESSTSGEDAIRISVKELEADNTNDATVAYAFLNEPGQRIVICTYQSLRNLSEVFKGLRFDLAIFDEAHKTAGRKSKLFAHALQDNGLKCARRLFMTATPRHAKLRANGKESQVFAMNDARIYGPVLYSLPLRRAIEAGIIDDYRIIVAVVSQQKTADLREQAIRVAIDRAMRVYGIRKVFTFHARVADAAGFILGATDTLKGVRRDHVNGKQSSRERGLRLEGFRNADAALMSNARCLTEGVDLPAADMVAFLSPKKNPIDIVQAVGRVLRKHNSKAKGGYVFLPVFVRDGEDAEAAIAESDWSSCYEVLQAMREQDGALAAALSKCARNGGLPTNLLVMCGGRREETSLENDRWQLSETLVRIMRVKLLTPFHKDSQGCKAELLAIASSGSTRPSKNALSRRLTSYTTKNACFDPVFNEKIRRLAPNWFVCTADIYKEKLRASAETGQPKKSLGDLRDAFYRYTNPKQQCFDAKLTKYLKVRAPHWFQSKDGKAALLRLAQRDRCVETPRRTKTRGSKNR